MMVVLWLVLLITGSMAQTSTISRDDFPQGFVFGSGTSAYQVEGAAAEDGRTPSIWDTYAHSGNVQGNGDVSCDGYHKYKEDVKLMAETGLEAYRFSISWSRLIPDGRGKINPKGLKYYNNLINELIRHGIKPHVTLFHFDHPQVLEDEYGGWLSPKMVDDFTAYADVCFREFGDRVSHWISLNEANVFALGGYDNGILPPKRCSNPFGFNCSHGNSILEPYIAGHHCLLAHSSVASLYKRKYQAKQQGFIGLNLLVFYFLPFTNSTSDIAAANRAQDFFIGWFVEPLIRGDYPKIMRRLAGTKIPKFSRNQSQQLMDSFDFIGVNYYVTLQVANDPNRTPPDQTDFLGDMRAKLIGSIYGKAGMEPTSTSKGLQGLLEHFKQAYGNPSIYIHENGYGMQQNETLIDTPRVQHLNAHLESLLHAIRNGSNTKGYFSWSFMDVFELFGGYKFSFGLYYVDFGDDERKRYPKLSAHWYSNFLKRRTNIIYDSSNVLSTYASM